jgi:hypothetical protein
MRDIELSKLDETPLSQILESFNAHQYKIDPLKWKTSIGSIVIEKNNGLRFHSFSRPNIKGKGAINLVKFMLDCDFNTAVKYLKNNFSTGLNNKTFYTKETNKTANLPFLPPVEVESNWINVKKYLVEERKLDPELLENLHLQKKIYADAKNNAVFATKIGCELRGTTGYFKGHRGKKGWFIGDFAAAEKVAFVESAIDAISYLILHENTAVVSCGGVNNDKLLEWIDKTFSNGKRVVLAFDDDEAGIKMVAEIQKVREQAEREIPEGKDWNKMLQDMLKNVKKMGC